MKPDFVVDFVKKFGGTDHDRGRSVQQTDDGGYILTGSTCSYGNGCDVYLIKTNAFGDTTFTKTFGGTGVESGESVQQTDDGGYILTGYTSSFGAGNLNFDVYLVKTNASGDSTFVNNFGDLLLDEFGNAVQQTKDRGYILTGSIEDIQGGGTDIYLIKTDPDGESTSKKNYGRNMKNDGGNAVQQTQDGGYILTGYTVSDERNSDVYLIKLKPDLMIDFENFFGGIKSDIGYAVQQTKDRGYIITGFTNSFETADSKVYLIKTNADGIVYQKMEQINACTF